MVDFFISSENKKDIDDISFNNELNGVYTVTSLHSMRKAAIVKITKKEGCQLSNNGNLKVEIK